MLKKIWHKITKGKTQTPAKQTIPQEQHRINAGHIASAARKTVTDLQKAGYEAYIVGGAIRDLLIGATPKDYDVATNATPSEIRAVFRRSRIIGRRFPIVHVIMGRETIEVTTFRSGGETVQNEQGRIMRDNSYGTLAEDAQRRDFTCNALYYDPSTGQITDFHNGVSDILARRLVIIGNPAERYREDPVRILRAIRLSAKLGFSIDDQTAAPIPNCISCLKNEPSARLFDEILKILMSGYSRRCLEQFRNLDIHSPVHPLLDTMLQASRSKQPDLVVTALKETDQRMREGKSVSVGFILACLMWDNLDTLWQKHLRHGAKPTPALTQAVAELREGMEKGWGVPQKFAATMHGIWILQPQFENRRGTRPFRLLAQGQFRAAYDFLLLRARFGQADQEWADWWQRFQQADQAGREAMIREENAKPAGAPAKRRRKPRTRKPRKSNNNPTE
ncbi:MAG: polynucleotide adenylyltransferase PcnB [Neisseria sp.]|nr:polynucleotide adenylyltransferase PcnB [Neisseria sp.]